MKIKILIILCLLLLAVTAFSTWSINRRQDLEAARAAEVARQLEAEREVEVSRRTEETKREIRDRCLQQAKQGYFSVKAHSDDTMTHLCGEYIDLSKARAEDATRAKAAQAKRARALADVAAEKER